MVRLPGRGAAAPLSPTVRCVLEAAVGVFTVDGAGSLRSRPEVQPAARAEPGECGRMSRNPPDAVAAFIIVICLFMDSASIQGGHSTEHTAGGRVRKQKHPVVRLDYFHSYTFFACVDQTFFLITEI